MKRDKKIEMLMLDFLNGEGLKKFAAYQQQEYFKQKEIERKNLIKEKYEYLKYKKENDFKLTIDQQKEYDFVKFVCEKK